MKESEIMPLILKAFKEDDLCLTNSNLLCGYVWRYQGAEEEMEFGEFMRGLMDGRFTSQGAIVKCLRDAKWKIAKEQ